MKTEKNTEITQNSYLDKVCVSLSVIPSTTRVLECSYENAVCKVGV